MTIVRTFKRERKREVDEWEILNAFSSTSTTGVSGAICPKTGRHGKQSANTSAGKAKVIPAPHIREGEY